MFLFCVFQFSDFDVLRFSVLCFEIFSFVLQVCFVLRFLILSFVIFFFFLKCCRNRHPIAKTQCTELKLANNKKTLNKKSHITPRFQKQKVENKKSRSFLNPGHDDRLTDVHFAPNHVTHHDCYLRLLIVVSLNGSHTRENTAEHNNCDATENIGSKCKHLQRYAVLTVLFQNVAPEGNKHPISPSGCASIMAPLCAFPSYSSNSQS